MPATQKALLTGTSGLIGTALSKALVAQGYEIFSLTRSTPKTNRQIQWDFKSPLDPATVSGYHAIINLAGESVFARWTDDKKKRIVSSRIDTTRYLAQAIAESPAPPAAFLSGSAVGYYGDRGNETLTESSTSGSGFLAEVARDWEAAASPAAEAGIRTVLLRTGIVLAREGGALKQMVPPFRLGLGGRIGNGKQCMSWIALQDWVAAAIFIIGHSELSGPINMVAPSPVSNDSFTRSLASALSRPALVPLPAIAVKLVFGQMGEETLLGSQSVQPAKLQQAGFHFEFETARQALGALLHE